jgi:hypothetical protein
MNKAFTKETDEEDDDALDGAPRPRGTQHITPEGFRALQAELKRLWDVERPKITDEVSAAAARKATGARTPKYIYGKKKLREIDRRIRFLRKRIDAVNVVSAPTDNRTRSSSAPGSPSKTRTANRCRTASSEPTSWISRPARSASPRRSPRPCSASAWAKMRSFSVPRAPRK